MMDFGFVVDRFGVFVHQLALVEKGRRAHYRVSSFQLASSSVETQSSRSRLLKFIANRRSVAKPFVHIV
jgi:hypothetical protein